MRFALEAVLLFAGVTVELLCCIGVLRMRIMYDRLHYLAPATFAGPLLIVLAIALRFQSLQMVLKAVAILVVLSITGPVVSRVLARAARARESKSIGPFPDDGS